MMSQRRTREHNQCACIATKLSILAQHFFSCRSHLIKYNVSKWNQCTNGWICGKKTSNVNPIFRKASSIFVKINFKRVNGRDGDKRFIIFSIFMCEAGAAWMPLSLMKIFIYRYFVGCWCHCDRWIDHKAFKSSVRDDPSSFYFIGAAEKRRYIK